MSNLDDVGVVNQHPYYYQQFTQNGQGNWRDLNIDAKLLVLDKMTDRELYRFCNTFDAGSICNSTKKLRDRRSKIDQNLAFLSSTPYFKHFLEIEHISQRGTNAVSNEAVMTAMLDYQQFYLNKSGYLQLHNIQLHYDKDYERRVVIFLPSVWNNESDPEILSSLKLPHQIYLVNLGAYYGLNIVDNGDLSQNGATSTQIPDSWLMNLGFIESVELEGLVGEIPKSIIKKWGDSLTTLIIKDWTSPRPNPSVNPPVPLGINDVDDLYKFTKLKDVSIRLAIRTPILLDFTRLPSIEGFYVGFY